MKKLIPVIVRITGIFMFGLSYLQTDNVKGAEFVIMNRVISWDMNAGDAFWNIPVDARWPTNWSSPNDYYNGKIYTRYEVLSVATNEPFRMQFGIFQWQPDANTRTECGELCELTQPLQGVGSVAINNSSPSTWWSSFGGVDFSRVVTDFQSMSVIIYSPTPSSWPVSPPANGGDPTGAVWSQRLKWFPVTIRATVIAVSKGSAFSGWDNYVPNAALQKPTPGYGIDFINETTDKVVPSTDEFSSFPTMYGVVSGDGQKMDLNPGEDAYFRTKAGDGLRQSEIQHFDIPCRPATPTFILDKVNHRTATIVSSDYEYSNNSDMSAAITGTGTNVSIPQGTTRYFRKKATESTFKSNIQALSESNKLPISQELLLFSDTIDYPNSTDTNGFFYFNYNADMPVNWRSPDSYYYGEIYLRYEMISEKTEAPVGFQFGIWQLLPPETGELHETMSEISGMNGTGSVVTAHSSPSTWWSLDDGFDYRKMDLTWHFGINPWQLNPSERQIRQENPSVWSSRFTNWFPMKVFVTVIAVAADHDFSGWDNYIITNPGGKKTKPNIGIDFINEQTDKAVPATIEYSVNDGMAGAVNGDGQKLILTPGQDVYFRTKAGNGLDASDIQHLVVPARPELSLSIDWENEKTVQTIASDIEYSDSASFSVFTNGNGSKINITPGKDLYFRKKGNASTFTSGICHLVSPGRPDGPVVTIDYINERTMEVLLPSFEYSLNESMAGAGLCNNDYLNLSPATHVYFRSKATDHSFTSLISVLNVPARPSAPPISVDFMQERTSGNITSDMEYSSFESFYSAVTGTGNKISLTPGQDLYLRIKSTTLHFSSEILHLDVPGRIFLSHFGPDTITEGKFVIFALLNDATPGLTPNNIHIVNGTLEDLTNGNVFDVNPLAKGHVFVDVPANAINGGNFASNELVLYYNGTISGILDFQDKGFIIYPNPNKDGIIFVRTKLNLPFTVGIFSVEGRLIRSFNMVNAELQQINLQDLQKGLYVLKINANDKTNVYKVILE
jgi:hypothetical protein